MKATVPISPTKICCACSYVLDGLTENRCPECGRVFDPSNAETFLQVGAQSDIALPLRRQVIAVILPMVFTATALVWMALPAQHPFTQLIARAEAKYILVIAVAVSLLALALFRLPRQRRIEWVLAVSLSCLTVHAWMLIPPLLHPTCISFGHYLAPYFVQPAFIAATPIVLLSAKVIRPVQLLTAILVLTAMFVWRAFDHLSFAILWWGGAPKPFTNVLHDALDYVQHAFVVVDPLHSETTLFLGLGESFGLEIALPWLAGVLVAVVLRCAYVQLWRRASVHRHDSSVR